MPEQFLRIWDQVKIVMGIRSTHYSSVSEMHSRLIRSGFYRNFRQMMNDVYLQERKSIEAQNFKFKLGQISLQDFQLVIIQKTVLITVHDNKFKNAIAYSKAWNTPIIYPISYKMQRNMRKIDLKFNRHFCHFIYLGMIFFTTLYRTVKVLRITNNECSVEKATENLVWIDGLLGANFPNDENPDLNLITWLCRKIDSPTIFMHSCSDFKSTIQIDNHSVCYSPSPFSQRGIFLKLKVVVKSLQDLTRIYISNSTVNLDAMIVFPELMMYHFARESKVKYKKVLCLSTRLVAKPLWCTFAESYGTQVLLLNYAIAAEPTLPLKPITQDGLWQLCTWNDSLVIDSQQIRDFSTLTNYPPSTFFVTGVPHWGGKSSSKIPNSKPLVSVFDTGIQTNFTFSAGILDELGWDDFNLEFKFIQMVLRALEPFDVVVAHKRKRAVRDFNSKEREHNLAKLSKDYKDKYIFIPEEVSADYLIQRSEAVVSKPISTTAISAVSQNKFSIFLDPTGTILISDPALRGIPIISSQSDLNEFFKSILQ